MFVLGGTEHQKCSAVGQTMALYLGSVQRRPWSLPKTSGPQALYEAVGPQPPMVLELLNATLQFNPDRRLTVEQTLALPYLEQLHCPEDEPVSPPIDLSDFEFERRKIDLSALREEIFLEEPPARGLRAADAGYVSWLVAAVFSGFELCHFVVRTAAGASCGSSLFLVGSWGESRSVDPPLRSRKGRGPLERWETGWHVTGWENVLADRNRNNDDEEEEDEDDEEEEDEDEDEDDEEEEEDEDEDEDDEEEEEDEDEDEDDEEEEEKKRRRMRMRMMRRRRRMRRRMRMMMMRRRRMRMRMRMMRRRRRRGGG
eukprot:Skav227264  [mRNA]  locus=scaffold3417:124212:131772:- [translate_table: standard]